MPLVIKAKLNIPCQDIVNVINIAKKADIGVVFSASYPFIDREYENEYEEDEYVRPRLTGKEYIKWRDKVKVKRLELEETAK